MLTRSQTRNYEGDFYSLPYTGRLFSPKYYPFSKLYQSSPSSGPNFLNILISKSSTFQNLVLDEIECRIGHRIPRVCQYQSEHHIETQRKQLKQLMKDKVPIMSHVPIRNSQFRLYGVLTLLVRNDELHRILPEETWNRLRSLELPTGEYSPIFITCSTIQLQSDDRTVRFSEQSENHIFKLYASNSIVKSRYGFIIGRRYTKNKKVYAHAFERIGVIDFSDVDQRKLAQKLKPAHQPKYENAVSEYSLYGCSSEHFENLREQNIYSIQDPRCTADTLGVSDWCKELVDKILETQRGTEKIRPTNIVFPTHEKRSLYIDFETLPAIINDPIDSLECTRHDFLFMIGIGTVVDGKWEYREITARELTMAEERRVLEEFFSAVYEMPSVAYHWYNAEPKMLKDACTRHNIKVPDIEWMDLHKYFKSIPITIKGCLDYSIKSVAKAMFAHGMIETTWDGDLSNGMECASTAYLWYHRKLSDRVMEDIIYYNEVDCKVMWEIVRFLTTL